MEHRRALALAGAVVMVGGSGAVAVGTLTGTIAPDAQDVPAVGPPASVDPGTAERRQEAAKPQVTRVTRTVDVPVPLPPAPAAPAPVPRVQPPVGDAAGADEVTDGEAAEEAAELLEERREERAKRIEERREEYREVLEERREERQDRLEDLRDDDSSGHGGSGHG